MLYTPCLHTCSSPVRPVNTLQRVKLAESPFKPAFAVVAVLRINNSEVPKRFFGVIYLR